MSLTETTCGSNPTSHLPFSQGVNLHQAPLRGKENALVHREASFRNECMLVNTVDPSIRVVQQTFRHPTVVLHTHKTDISCCYVMDHTLGMPNNTRSILRFKHEVAAPTACCRTSCTVKPAHGCLSSLKADSGSLRSCQLLFRAPASDGATMNVPYKCFTIWRNTTPK